MNPTVYIVISNNGYGLRVEATLHSWKDESIVASAEVEDITIDTVPQPLEDEYRHWVTAVARSGARALEDALMKRVYVQTAKEPLTWKPKTKTRRVTPSPDR